MKKIKRILLALVIMTALATTVAYAGIPEGDPPAGRILSHFVAR